MAIAQPLTAFSNSVDDATLETIDREAPRIRAVHQALDACAEESGPQRYESARRAAPTTGDGAFYLMGAAPSTALAALFEIADGTGPRFSEQLALSLDLAPPEGALRVLEAHPASCDPHAPMDTFLRMLERDEATSPAMLEGLFEELEGAHRDGLITLDAGGLSLTDKGRGTIHQTHPALEPLNDAALGRVDLYAQEVADGRLNLREAIVALGTDLGLTLPVPGQPDEIDAATSFPDAGVRIDTSSFDPLLLAVSDVASRDRGAVATVALHRRLEEWGLTSEDARSILSHDIRCLRALGASLSHGPIDMSIAREVVANGELEPVVDVAMLAIPDSLLEGLAGPKRFATEDELETADTDFPDGTEDTAVLTQKRGGLLRRLLSVFLKR